MKKFEVLSKPGKIYRRMLEDIKNARKSIYLETYIYDDDRVGRIFRKYLEKKVKEGVEVKVLVDAWGSGAKKDFFKRLKETGGEIRFFREFKYAIRIFSKNQERNHRKLLLIDNRISYLGSINITESCLKWRELVLRMEGGITEHFVESFKKSWETHGKFSAKRINKLVHRGFEIIQDTPSKISKPTERGYVRLINKAKDSVMIETPYFIPSRSIRKALARAAKRGAIVKLIVPYISDVKIADAVRERDMGEIWRAGAYIYYYKRILHSKLLIIDEDFFMLGSSNLDYRSFIHNYDINLIGKNKKITLVLKEYYNKALGECILFDYEKWKARSSFSRIAEIFLVIIKKYL